MTTALTDPATFERLVDQLNVEQLGQLGALLTARANLRRTLTEQACWDAVMAAPLTEGWLRSRFADVGRVRIACRILIIHRHLHPEQIYDPMLSVAHMVCPHPSTAEEVVACGIADGLAAREGEPWVPTQ
jgi:hypothetical protein